MAAGGSGEQATLPFDGPAFAHSAERASYQSYWQPYRYQGLE